MRRFSYGAAGFSGLYIVKLKHTVQNTRETERHKQQQGINR